MNDRVSKEPYSSFSARAFERSGDDGTHPIKAHFEITYRCNLHCVHCYTDPFNTSQDIRRELSLEEITGILDQLADAGVLWLTLSGGEAVLHPQFREIYRRARARGFLVSLLSNATVITESLASFLAEDPPFKLEVTLHSSLVSNFDAVTTVGGSFARFEEGVDRLLAYGLPVRLKTNLLTLNQNDLESTKAWAEARRLKFNLYTSIYPRLNGDLTSVQYRVPASELLEIEDRFLGGVTDAQEGCTTFSPPADDRLFRCGCGTSSLTINPYGVLRACTFTTWPAYDLRSLPLKQAFAQLVEEIHKARYTGVSPCRSCEAHAFCDKNPVMAQAESGSMEAPVPHFCDVAFGRKAKEAVFLV